MPETYDRREFVEKLVKKSSSLLLLWACGPVEVFGEQGVDDYDTNGHYYGMGIQVDRCIGCARCVEACKIENDVPEEPIYFRTWIERYIIDEEGEATVDSPEGGLAGFPPVEEEQEVLRSFFVPKLCNHCDNPPCVQVCPVGATFMTPDGVTLVDSEYCIGCSYCIQACPYGARYLDPRSRTAGKCTFCYHRITKGLSPACVEVCPAQARVFGELKTMASPLRRIMRMSQVQTLKPYLNTEPKVYYAALDQEVR
jgi:Fe-S-cluster-containing dehydrogenase component